MTKYDIDKRLEEFSKLSELIKEAEARRTEIRRELLGDITVNPGEKTRILGINHAAMVTCYTQSRLDSKRARAYIAATGGTPSDFETVTTTVKMEVC
jgi:hypothetical protein